MSKSFSVLLGLMNSLGRKELDTTKLHFGPATPSTGIRNTTIEIRSIKGSGLYGRFLFRYNRMDLSNFEDITVNANTATDLVGLLPQLNLDPLFYYALEDDEGVAHSVTGELFDEDIVNQTFTLDPVTHQAIVSLQAKVDSYLFIGETLIKVIP